MLSSKRGNKNYYKGTQAKRMGQFTQKGRFVVEKRRDFEVPKGILEARALSPYIASEPSDAKN